MESKKLVVIMKPQTAVKRPQPDLQPSPYSYCMAINRNLHEIGHRVRLTKTSRNDVRCVFFADRMRRSLDDAGSDGNGRAQRGRLHR